MSEEEPFEPTESKDDEEIEKAVEEMFSKVQDFADEVTAGRVALATLFLLMIIGGIFAGWYWVIPRDSVEVETVYFQRGGHVVMSLVNNDGSRAITDVEVDVKFIDSSGVIIESMGVTIAEIPSHSSISGDDLEMHIQGYTVWAEYTIEIEVKWKNWRGEKQHELWKHRVGDWVSEKFSDESDTTVWPF